MRSRREGGPRPVVLARLAEEAEVRGALRAPPRWVRGLGYLIVLAILGTVVLAALEVSPW